MKMIVCLVYISGYEVNDDHTQTLVYAYLLGVFIDAILKHFSINLGEIC